MQGVPGGLSGPQPPDGHAELAGRLSPAAAAGLSALRAEPAGALVALDYDGTLAEVVPDPAAAVPVDGALDLLAHLARHVRAVVIITGRPAAELPRLAGLDAPGAPAVTVLGLYGRQRWDAAAGLRAGVPPAGIAAARAALAEALPAWPAGLRVEDKGDALAVHARGLTDPDVVLAALSGELAALATRHGLRIQPGRMVREILPGDADKGAALRAFAAEVAARSVLYAGDDVGDLPAFAAVRALRERGVAGLSVGISSVEAPQVEAAADITVPGPPALVRLLRDLAGGWSDGVP